jgi:hypothetical protein
MELKEIKSTSIIVNHFFLGIVKDHGHHDKSGLFSVKSAYKLALELKSKGIETGTSTKPARERYMWNIIWKANVPPKVHVFGWKLATNSLGIQATRCARNMDKISTCCICGVTDETSHHAMVECTKVKALRQRLRQVWALPDEKRLQYTVNDWVLVLLSQLDDSMRGKLLLLWWRAWHFRNNAILGDGKCKIEQSALYLISYLDSIQNAKGQTTQADIKGKQSVLALKEKDYTTPAEKWKEPSLGWAKLNSDASFFETDYTGSWEPF